MGRNYLLITAAPLVLTSHQVLAQSSNEAGVGVEDIIVTAQKREERLQDVPIAITAFGAESLENKNIQSINDVRKLSVPGLVTSQQTGAPIIGINIRGISTQDQQQATLEPPTAVYIDGVYIPRTQGLGGELIEVDRIEVLRGPQGTLFGRNAEGGAISIVSKIPSGEFGGSIGGDIGNYGMKKGYIHLNTPKLGTIAGKIDSYFKKFDGFTKNGPQGSNTVLRPDQQRNFGQQDSWGVRGQLLWQPSSDFTALLSADYSKIRAAQTYQHFDAPTALLAAPELDHYVKRSAYTYYRPYSVTSVKGGSAVLTYDVSDNVTIKSITAYRKVTDKGGGQLQTYSSFPSFFPTDPAGTLLSGIFANAFVSSRTFSEEVQLLGTAGEFQYTAGVFYFREKAADSRGNFVTLRALPGQAPTAIQPVDLGSTSFQTVNADTFAMFGQATWTPGAFDDKLKITAGLRYTEANKRAERTVFNNKPLATPIRARPTSVNRFDPALTIAYDFTSEVNVYLRYAQAFRDGGVSVRSPNFSSFGPEENKQVEFGVKSDLFDRMLRLNAAVFHSWVKDQQINVTPPNDPTQQDIVNVSGTTKLWGAEFEATLVPTRGLTLAANLSLMDGKQPLYPCGGCNRVAITYLPHTSVGGSIDYVTPINGLGDGFIHLDYRYMSEFHTSPKAFPGEVWPASKANVMDARVGLKNVNLGGLSANLAAYVDNVFDNHSVVFDTNVKFQTLQEPRRFGIQASIDF